MITAILIDDEKASLVALEAKLSDCEDEVRILAQFQNPTEALNELKRYDPDVIFLDIDMPQMDGFAFLNRLPERNFEVIFTTAFSQYIINALRQEAFDFLVKPIIQEELCDAVNRIAAKTKTKNTQKKQINTGKIALPSTKGVQFINKEDLIYVKAEKNYCTFYLKNETEIVVSKTLKEYEDQLENLGFFRIHHGTMINLHHILEYIKGEGGTVIMSNGTELEVARRRKQDFLDAMM
ncbi:MAG: LytR/AlgR family response regulator transcription factor [Leadbetterella sp.]